MNTSTQLLVVLGDIGGHHVVDALPSSMLTTPPVTVKSHVWFPSHADDLGALAGLLAEGDPAVVCIGSDVPEVSALWLAQRLPSLVPAAEVVMVTAPAPDLWPRAVRAGVRDIVDPAGGLQELVLALEAAVTRAVGVREATGRVAPATRSAKVICVLSPKGGSGKTMLSVNLSVALARSAPERVVLVDYDCQFGDVSTTLGLDPDRTLGDLVLVPHLDASTVKLFLVQDPHSPLYVLPAAGKPNEADLVDEAMAAQILELLAGEFDYVVVDTAAGLDHRVLAALSLATDLLFVASMDVTSVRNLVKEIDLIDQLGITAPTRHFVLNRVDPKSGLRIEDIEAAVGMPVQHRVEASSSVLTAMNAGRSVVATEPSSPAARSITDLAGAIQGAAGGAGDSGRRSLFRRR